MRVVVSMSGGVDSAICAYLLKKKGYEVIGITLKILPEYLDRTFPSLHSCCSFPAISDAKAVAAKIGIPHYVLDFKDIFQKMVISDFINEYSQGRTPNPCIRCNQSIKFYHLLHKAKQLGAKLSTGHYVRLEYSPFKKRYLLKKAKDKTKDQSYALYTLAPSQLEDLLFPIGEMSKKEVRSLAKSENLLVAEKRESQEICFIPDNDYRLFINKFYPHLIRAGKIIDTTGKVRGEHKGIAFYTIGQRRNIGISGSKYPLYVVKIDERENLIVVGEEKELYQRSFTAVKLNWIAIDNLSSPLQIKAKIRYNSEEADAMVYPQDEDRVRVEFKEKQRAITPGQAVVFYDGDILVGGGTIDKVEER